MSLVRIRRKDPMFDQIHSLFETGWIHDKSKPEIYGIYKIIHSTEFLKPYLAYRSDVNTACIESETSLCEEHERLLFHGTHQLCSVGENKQNVRLCRLRGCSMCSIIRSSFEIKRAGFTHKFKRFGAGIYTTSCSSKADDYASNFPGNETRALLLNRVVLGVTCKKMRNDTKLKKAPRGFDSVAGVPGIDLNYDEMVVYSNSAIRPAYLVVYGPVPQAASFRKVITNLFKTPIAS